MCLDPSEISYSHITEITLQDAPNVISLGFSNRISCNSEILTSNIMDFSLFSSSAFRCSFVLKSFLFPVEIPSQSLPLRVRALFWIDLTNLDKQFQARRRLTKGIMVNMKRLFLLPLEESREFEHACLKLRLCLYQ